MGGCGYDARTCEGASIASATFERAATSGANAKTGKILTVRCDECGLVKRGFFWQPGAVCPSCGSKEFFPVVTADSQAFRQLPDRTDGPARMDRVFAQVVRWAGLADEKDLCKCLNKQEKLAAAHWLVPGIDEILVRRGLLTDEQRDAVFEVWNFQQLRAGLFWDQEDQFLAAAVRKGWLSGEEAATLRQGFEEAALKGRQAAPMGYFAMELGFLTESQVRAIYQEEAAEGRGLLHEVRMALQVRSALPEAKAHRSGSWLQPLAVAATALFAVFIS